MALVEGSPAQVCFISPREHESLDLKGKHTVALRTLKPHCYPGMVTEKNKQTKKLYSEGGSGKHPQPRPTAEDGADSPNRPTPNTQGLRSLPMTDL